MIIVEVETAQDSWNRWNGMSEANRRRISQRFLLTLLARHRELRNSDMCVPKHINSETTYNDGPLGSGIC